MSALIFMTLKKWVAAEEAAIKVTRKGFTFLDHEADVADMLKRMWIIRQKQLETLMKRKWSKRRRAVRALRSLRPDDRKTVVEEVEEEDEDEKSSNMNTDTDSDDVDSGTCSDSSESSLSLTSASSTSSDESLDRRTRARQRKQIKKESKTTTGCMELVVHPFAQSAQSGASDWRHSHKRPPPDVSHVSLMTDIFEARKTLEIWFKTLKPNVSAISCPLKCKSVYGGVDGQIKPGRQALRRHLIGDSMYEAVCGPLKGLHGKDSMPPGHKYGPGLKFRLSA